jgi:thioredoxin reductase
MTTPIVIIGAGPAGVEAAVQLRRSRTEFLLLERERVGGLLNQANRVENFPGVPDGVPGRRLAARLKRQLDAAGIAVEKARVLTVTRRDGHFAIATGAGTCTAEKVILASGTQPLPPAPPLDPARLRGRLYTSVLPLLRARGETIAIIGGGDVAFDYALSLAASNRVHVLVRAAKPRALPLLVERCRLRPEITIHENSRLTDVRLLENGEIALRTVHAPDGRGGEIRSRRILTAIGRVPALGFLDPGLWAEMDELIMKKMLFLAGDAGGGRFRYAAVAAADGLRAAMEILAAEGSWN